MKIEQYPTWLVPIDIAKELKEIGFDKACVYYPHPCPLRNHRSNSPILHRMRQATY